MKPLPLVLFLLVILLACGRDESSRDEEPQTEQEAPEESLPIFLEDSFSTRINLNLLIAGEKCEGGERVEIGIENQLERVECLPGQWVITVDNANTCTPDGACTQIGVLPFIGVLEKDNNWSTTRIAYYDILPVIGADRETKRIVSNYWVRFDANGEPTVLRKR